MGLKLDWYTAQEAECVNAASRQKPHLTETLPATTDTCRLAATEIVYLPETLKKTARTVQQLRCDVALIRSTSNSNEQRWRCHWRMDGSTERCPKTKRVFGLSPASDSEVP